MTQGSGHSIALQFFFKASESVNYNMHFLYLINNLTYCDASQFIRHKIGPIEILERSQDFYDWLLVNLITYDLNLPKKIHVFLFWRSAPKTVGTMLKILARFM
jgi:hypothetical protein